MEKILEFIINSPITGTIGLIILPALILPFLMRFIVGFIILSIVRRKYLPHYLAYLNEGWKEADDRILLEKIKKIVLGKLKYHFLFRFTLVADMKEILKEIETFYDGAGKDLQYSFTLERGAYCFLLAFCDIYSEYAGTFWFRLIKNLKLSWFFRVRSVGDIVNRFNKLPIIRSLRKIRVLTKVLRILLAPLIGLPHAIFYFFRSLGISLFYEGFLRLLYALILMKGAYYSLFLYGRGNTRLDQRIKEIPKEKLRDIYREIKNRIDPLKRKEKSKNFVTSLVLFNRLMEKFEVPRGVALEKGGFADKMEQFWNSVRRSTTRAYSLVVPLKKDKAAKDKDNFLELFKEIGSGYFPKEEPLRQLRIHEVLEIGYMAGVMAIYKLVSTPVVKQLAEKITVNMLVDFKRFTDKDITKKNVKNIKEGYKFLRIFSVLQKIFTLTRGLSGPYGLILTLGSPILFQQFKDLVRVYLYHNAGRLIIYCFENNVVRSKQDLTPMLW